MGLLDGGQGRFECNEFFSTAAHDRAGAVVNLLEWGVWGIQPIDR